MRQEILESHPDQWDFFDAPPTWVHKSNRDLSIRLLRKENHQDRKIDQPEWASTLPNPTTAEDDLRVEYRGAPIAHLPVIQLDEYRVTMVYPDTEVDEESEEFDYFLTEFEAHLSRIMSQYDFDQKMKQLDVTIE